MRVSEFSCGTRTCHVSANSLQPHAHWPCAAMHCDVCTLRSAPSSGNLKGIFALEPEVKPGLKFGATSLRS